MPNNLIVNPYKDFNYKQNSISKKSYKKTQNKNIDKIEAAIGSTVATGLGLAYMMKKQRVKNPFKLEYGLMQMCSLSALSILGGVGLSMHGNDIETNKRKFKEGVFQFSNAAVPAWLASASLKLCEANKKYNKPLLKVISVLGAVLVGMHGAASLANKLFDPKDLEPDRKLKMKDCIANVDDLLGVLVLAKVPLIKNIPFERALPFVYAYCGYKAGKSE